jgi:hypothetical protein
MRVYPPLRYPRGMYGLGQDPTITVTPTYVDPTTGDTVMGDPTSVAILGGGDVGTPLDTSNLTITPSASSTSSNSTTAQDIAALGPALAAASKALSTATGPYQISGTNYIYNPATGQILLNGAAVGMYNPNTGALSALNAASSFTSMLPMILGVGAIVLVVSMLGGRK